MILFVASVLDAINTAHDLVRRLSNFAPVLHMHNQFVVVQSGLQTAVLLAKNVAGVEALKGPLEVIF